MFCQSCGKQLNEGTKFCTSCGKPVSNPGSGPVNAGPGVPPPPPVQQNPYVQQGPSAQYGPPEPLNYKIFGENLPAVSIRLQAGQSIYTQSGGMTWMDSGICRGAL